MKEKKQSDQKNPEQFLAFAATLFIDHGGVLDYTDNLALQLQAVGKLKAAIAPEARKINRPYKIEEFNICAKRKNSRVDKFPPLSKLVTLFYFLIKDQIYPYAVFCFPVAHADISLLLIPNSLVTSLAFDHSFKNDPDKLY